MGLALNTTTDSTSNVAIGDGAMRSGGNQSVGVGFNALFASTSSAQRNVAVGYGAGAALTTGGNNFFGGFQSGSAITTGSNNVALGNGALDAATTGGRNIAIGQDAMGLGVATAASGDNIAIGYRAGYDLTSATDNVLIGELAGENITTGLNNVCIGLRAGDSVTTAGNSVMIGRDAGAAVTTAAENTFVGDQCGTNITGDGNTALGYLALYGGASPSTSQSTSIGYFSGYRITSGIRNTFVGASAGSNATNGTTTGTNNTIIGYDANASSATVSNEITLGNSSITRFRVPGAGIDNTSAALSGTTPSVDVGARDTYTLTTSGNTTFTFTGVPSSGQVGTFSLIITAGGTHTLTWPASVDWAGGTAPAAPASGEKDIYTFMTIDGGTIWYGFLAGDAMA
jgi:hypothetical protein